MKDCHSLFQQFQSSLKAFPNTDLEMHSNLLSDLSETRLFNKCMRLQQQKCKQLGMDCLNILDSILQKNKSTIFVFPSVFHQIIATADLERVFEYFIASIILSNKKFKTLELMNFDEFITVFVHNDQCFDRILDKSEKQFLRSPESILKVIGHIVQLIGDKIDTGRLLVSKFDYLCNQIKSNNQIVKDDAVFLFSALACYSKDFERNKKVIDELVKNVLPKCNTEQRTLLFTVMDSFPKIKDVSMYLLRNLEKILIKEINENALMKLLDIFVNHSNSCYDGIDIPFTEILLKGLRNQKPVIRVIFFSRLLKLRKLGVKFGDLEKKIVDEMIDAISQVQKLGISILDPKVETRSYMEGVFATAFLLLDKSFRILPIMQSVDFFLFNQKLYAKSLANVEDYVVYLKTLHDLILNPSFKIDLVASHISESVIRSIISSPSSCYRSQLDLVQQIVKKSSDQLNLINILCSGIRTILQEQSSINSEEEILAWPVTVVRSSNVFGVRIYDYIQALLQSLSNALDIEMLLLEVVILISHPLVCESVGIDGWVRLCFKLHVSPSKILEKYGSKQITLWMQNSSDGMDGSSQIAGESFRKALLNCIVLFTEIKPSMICRIILPQCLPKLTSDTLRSLTERDLGIWFLPEGEIFENPLPKSKKDQAKTSDEKWEIELKKELKSKTISKNSKFTKQERELISQQLKLESERRQIVETSRQEIENSIDLIASVLIGIIQSLDAEAKTSFFAHLKSILKYFLGHLDILEKLLGSFQSECNDIVLNGSRSITILQKIYQLFKLCPPQLTQDDIYSSVMFTMTLDHIEAFQPPRKIVSYYSVQVIKSLQEELSGSVAMGSSDFNLIFPLLKAIVFREKRIADLSFKIWVELCILASDLIIIHSGLDGLSQVIPREEMLECLIEILSKFPRLKSSGKDAMAALIMSSTNTLEDLDEANRQTLDSEKLAIKSLTALLLDGLLSENDSVREACISSLSYMTSFSSDMLNDRDVRVWISKNDKEEIAVEANRLWIDFHGESPITKESISTVIELIVHPVPSVRDNAAAGLAKALEVYPYLLHASLNDLFTLYKEKVKPPEPKYDSYGLISLESFSDVDFAGQRSGIAVALQKMVDIIQDGKIIADIFEFLIDAQALGDPNADVQTLMREAGLKFVAKHGHYNVEILFSIFDRYLSQPAKAARDHDSIRESVVLFSGTLACHLKEGDRLISDVIIKVVDTLKTPSESVQKAVGDCLPALIRLQPKESPKLLDILMTQLFESPKYGERKGAAFGIAGIVKGCGLSSLRDHNILGKLKSAIDDKKNVRKREGALFAYETLSLALGRRFEPYVVSIMPLLLVCFGDSSGEVREATSFTARTIMSSLSAHCIKLILPKILEGLQDRNWRTKTGSIDMLASMSYLAPKQLSQNLPTIIPRLCDTLSDTHVKVQDAGKQGLYQFGKIIKNPEIQALVPTLIEALVDPTKNTLAALTAILDTPFSHYIDPPSLALLVPILKRAYKERGIDLKMKCGQIIGNLVTLTDHQDLVTYLPIFLSGLRELLLDPVPEIRAISAKALGILVENLGESNFPNLVSDLLESLKLDNGAVDRSGSAQGLSEVIAGLGLEKLDMLLPDIIANSSSSEIHVKEGFMTMFIYLPVTHGPRFTPYLERIIPSILSGVADEAEQIRSVAMKSAQVIIQNYAVATIELLLPKLEKGMFSENWRNRLNCLQLIGDILFKLAGFSAKSESLILSEDENDSGTETGRKALIQALGEHRFFEILSCLYLIRNDSISSVRQLSLQIWKSIVVNTPKTLKEILTVLIKFVISNLASKSSDKRIIAAKALADLVQKLGELVMVEIIPILTSGLESNDSFVRQGVCVGISEILSSGKEEIEDFIESYVPLVKKALVDPEPEVREAAAKAFEMMHHVIGSKAIDDIIPDLLNELRFESDSSLSLAALQELMQVRGNSVFPILLPTLLATPITKFNASALGSLIKVSGPSISRRLTNILPSLMLGLEQADEAVPMIEETLGILLSNIYGDDSVHHVMSTLFEVLKSGPDKKRITVFTALRLLYENSKEDLTSYNTDWISNLLLYFNGKDGDVLLKASWSALDSLVKTIKKEDLDKYVLTAQKALDDTAQVLSKNNPIPGLDLPKGLNPILPIFLQGLMFGNSDVRETSAFALGEIVNRTSLEALKPFVIQITGPLIRVIGDKFNPNVKAAILKTLGILLQKAPTMLRPFLPQLQRTFVKSLTEAQNVREMAAQCLSYLIPLQPRLDPLLVELVQTCQNTDDKGIKRALLEAIYHLTKGVKDTDRDFIDSSKMALEKLLSSLIMISQEGDDIIRECVTKCFGIYLALISPSKSAELLSNSVFRSLKTSDSSWISIHTSLLVLNNILMENPKLLLQNNYVEETIKAVLEGLKHDKNSISQTSSLIASKLLLNKDFEAYEIQESLFDPILGILKNTEKSSDTRRQILLTIKKIAKIDHTRLDLKKTIPVLMACVRERTIPVKLAAERALVHVLKLDVSEDILTEYVKTLGSNSRSVTDYVRRVLVKIASNESDEE